MTTDTNDLTILGSTVRRSISAAELETFPTPVTAIGDGKSPGVAVVIFETDEFTAMCPVTEQPDAYRLKIMYGPGEKCIESKSLKLYLWGFRDRGAFAEALAVEIADDIHLATGAIWTKVKLDQSTRGGITTTTIAERGRHAPAGVDR